MPENEPFKPHGKQFGDLELDALNRVQCGFADGYAVVVVGGVMYKVLREDLFKEEYGIGGKAGVNSDSDGKAD